MFTAIKLFFSGINWGKALPKVAIALLVLAALGVMLLIKTEWDNKEEKVLEYNARANQAIADRIAAEAASKAWERASVQQNEAIKRLEHNQKQMQISMQKQQEIYEERFVETTKLTNSLTRSAQALVDAPAASPDMEIPRTRAVLRDTKGYAF